MSDLVSDIAEYCRNVERKPIKRMELVQNYMADAAVNNQWTRGTVKQCELAIEEACKRGLLSRASETIWVPVVAVEAKPVQKGLFDYG